MLLWIPMFLGMFAFVIMLVQGSPLGTFLSFGFLFGSFATCCILHDGPSDRANARMSAHLAGLHSHAEAQQRMVSAKVRITRADRQLPISMMTGLNVLAAIGCCVTLIWGIVISFA